MTSGVSESQFYMWRTLFAVAHADDVVTKEEVEFMAHVLEDVSFSEEQTAVLKDDIVNAKNIEQMFEGITNQDDRTRFFELARDLVWIDGDFGTAEQGVMIKLFQNHFRQTDVDDLIGKVTLELEDEPQPSFSAHHKDMEYKQGRSAFMSFRDRFLSLLGKR